MYHQFFQKILSKRRLFSPDPFPENFPYRLILPPSHHSAVKQVFGIESEDTVAKYLTEQGCKDGFQVHHGSFASDDCAIMRQNPSKPTLFFAFNDLLTPSDTTTLWEHLWERQLSLSDEVAAVATSLRGITDEVFSQCTVEVAFLFFSKSETEPRSRGLGLRCNIHC